MEQSSLFSVVLGRLYAIFQFVARIQFVDTRYGLRWEECRPASRDAMMSSN